MIPTTNKTALGKTTLGIVARPGADRAVRHNSGLGNSRRPGPWILNSLAAKNVNPGTWYSILHNRPLWICHGMVEKVNVILEAGIRDYKRDSNDDIHL